MRMVLVIFIALIVSSCVTPPKTRPASEFLLTSEKGITQSLADVNAALTQKKYKIKQVNHEVGILITQPRGFAFSRGGSKVAARQTVQLRQEGGSVKLRLVYECETATEAGDLEFKPCLLEDSDAAAKILRLDSITAGIVRDALKKKPSSGDGSGDGTNSTWGTEIK